MLKVKELAEEARGTDFDSTPPDEFWKSIAAFFGLPLEFDTVEQERRPWATWTLCLAIICASAFAFTQLHQVVLRFGLIPAEATRPMTSTTRSKSMTDYRYQQSPIQLTEEAEEPGRSVGRTRWKN